MALQAAPGSRRLPSRSIRRSPHPARTGSRRVPVTVSRRLPAGSRPRPAPATLGAVTRDEQILRALADGAASTADLVERTGLPARTVQHGLHQLTRAGHIVSPERGAYRLAGLTPEAPAAARPLSPSAGAPPAKAQRRAAARTRPLAPMAPDPTPIRDPSATPPPPASGPPLPDGQPAAGGDQPTPRLASLLAKAAILGTVAIIGLAVWNGRAGDGQAGSPPPPSPGGWPVY